MLLLEKISVKLVEDFLAKLPIELVKKLAVKFNSWENFLLNYLVFQLKVLRELLVKLLEKFPVGLL